MTASRKVTKLRVTHVYTIAADTGDMPDGLLAALVEDRLADDPTVYGLASSDWTVGTGADFGTSSTESVTVEVL